VIVPTHFAVIANSGRYVVVEKFGESAITAIDLDPRKPA
jgi:hypothetical protein